jgi:hypothetical protein
MGVKLRLWSHRKRRDGGWEQGAQQHTTKTYGGDKGEAPQILNPETRWEWAPLRYIQFSDRGKSTSAWAGPRSAKSLPLSGIVSRPSNQGTHLLKRVELVAKQMIKSQYAHGFAVLHTECKNNDLLHAAKLPLLQHTTHSGQQPYRYWLHSTPLRQEPASVALQPDMNALQLSRTVI